MANVLTKAGVLAYARQISKGFKGRVSEAAAEEILNALREEAKVVVQNAFIEAQKQRRITLKKQDIENAVEITRCEFILDLIDSFEHQLKQFRLEVGKRYDARKDLFELHTKQKAEKR